MIPLNVNLSNPSACFFVSRVNNDTVEWKKNKNHFDRGLWDKLLNAFSIDLRETQNSINYAFQL